MVNCDKANELKGCIFPGKVWLASIWLLMELKVFMPIMLISHVAKYCNHMANSPDGKE